MKIERAQQQKKRALVEQAKIFKALGHPSRLLMVDALRFGEKCVCEIRELVGDDMSTISRHLAILREAGVVTSERRGTSIYYRLKLACLGTFLECTAHAVAQKATEHLVLLGEE